MGTEIGRYDAWLHWSVSEKCVMNCAYCQSSGGDDSARRNAPLSTIDLPRLLKTLAQTQKTFRISFTGGGEPFLVPNLVETCLELTKHHYLSFNTNLVEKYVTDFLEKIDPRKVLYIDASCHLKALERRHLFDQYIQNFLGVRKKGIPIHAIEVAYPPILPEVEKYKALFGKHGIDLTFGPFWGVSNGKAYPKAYTDEELEGFGFTRESVHIHYPHSKQPIPFCNAGYNVGIVRANGDITPCDFVTKSIGNIYQHIAFNKHLLVCPFERCNCPLYHHDPYLFEQAKQEDRGFIRWHVWKKRIGKIIHVNA